MNYSLKTKLDGDIVITSDLCERHDWLSTKDLYKFIWMQEGSLTIEVDHVDVVVNTNEVLTLSPLHHIKIKECDGKYLTLLFNSNFYCIYGHDSEVSCNGLLFNGSSNILKLKLTPEQVNALTSISAAFTEEWDNADDLQEEMLRITLKRLIIICTRIARDKYEITQESEKYFDIVRQFYVLVDNNFRTKKQVKEYADMLCRSPKTLTNLCADYGFPSPLQIIHDRINAEARRLLLYTSKSAKEISDILGFEDSATFSRFFKNKTGNSISEFRKSEKKE